MAKGYKLGRDRENKPVRFFRDEKHILVFFLEDEMETKFFLRETSFPNFFQLIINKMVI